jgi:hypothetical protein
VKIELTCSVGCHYAVTKLRVELHNGCRIELEHEENSRHIPVILHALGAARVLLAREHKALYPDIWLPQRLTSGTSASTYESQLAVVYRSVMAMSCQRLISTRSPTSRESSAIFYISPFKSFARHR